MPQREWLILMVVGGLFIFLGLGGIIAGSREERGYYDSLSRRFDVREYLEHWPERPALRALIIGGWIALALGIIMVASGGALWFLGKVS